MAPPNNPWFLDLPIEWMPAWLDLLGAATIESYGTSRALRIAGGVSGWSAEVMDELRPEVEPEAGTRAVPGPAARPEDGIFTPGTPEWWTFLQHGMAKGAALLLGVEHRHDGEDLLLTGGWEAMLEGFGFGSEGSQPLAVEDMVTAVQRRIADLRNAAALLEAERARTRALEMERATVRIAAETDARQRGLGIAETDDVGRQAAAEVPDPGPADPKAYHAAQTLEDDHIVDGLLPLVRRMSRLRWEHSAPVRVGCRMGRPGEGRRARDEPDVPRPVPHRPQRWRSTSAGQR